MIRGWSVTRSIEINEGAGMNASKLQAWWAHRQGLDGSLAGADAAGVLERTGGARSGGGVGPYLTLFSRAPISRQAAEKAASGHRIHQLPSAPGCTYVGPQGHFALALAAGRGLRG